MQSLQGITRYSIACGKFRMETTDCFGAHILSLTYDGRPVYVPLESEEQLLANRFLHGSPLLLPANRTVDGKFSFEGKDYMLPINERFNNCHLHGELYLHRFRLLRHEADCVEFAYENIGESYPFPFRLRVQYAVSETACTQRYYLENSGETAMPYTFALHTTFARPARFSVPLGLATPRNEQTYLPIGEDVPLNAKQCEYKNGYTLKGEKITGYYTACGHTVTVGDFVYTVSDNFDHWVLYGDESGEFVCIEPQRGAVNGLNLENGHGVLAVGESVEFMTSIMPITK